MDPLTLALLGMAVGGGAGALTNLNHPDQMMKNATMGMGIGGLAGGGLGMSGLMPGAAPIELGASSTPGYSLLGQSSMPAMNQSLQGLPALAGESSLMGGGSSALASASGGTMAGGGGVNRDLLMKIMMFRQMAGLNNAPQQQQPMPSNMTTPMPAPGGNPRLLNPMYEYRLPQLSKNLSSGR